jgi:hypothetical protein
VPTWRLTDHEIQIPAGSFIGQVHRGEFDIDLATSLAHRAGPLKSVSMTPVLPAGALAIRTRKCNTGSIQPTIVEIGRQFDHPAPTWTRLQKRCIRHQNLAAEIRPHDGLLLGRAPLATRG